MIAVWIALFLLALVRTTALLQILRRLDKFQTPSGKKPRRVHSALAAHLENWRAKRAVKEIEKYDKTMENR